MAIGRGRGGRVELNLLRERAVDRDLGVLEPAVRPHACVRMLLLMESINLAFKLEPKQGGRSHCEAYI